MYTQPDDPMYDVSAHIVRAQKVVFSNTLAASLWENTQLAKGDLTAEVKALKAAGGKDMIVYGGSSFVTSLIREGLIDEYYLFVNPVVLGKGEGIFGGLANYRGLVHRETLTYPSGIVLLKYVAAIP
ncbi:dihydrofolate reductase family protein [Chitinophaga pendula]|uniref:dihydrofolate reductase family protein n=1 Tax=Chitinophaga pendula TaxID=2849666 RepID=UPI001CEC880A|nr:dihydrofolate reductase family protein [Chitinophaga pendula]UCJ09724.1 dihydrofolate reductase family protein [Chitinophaga pendula]